jgi:hypothetical protein
MKIHQPPQESANQNGKLIPFPEYRRQHPLTWEQIERNRVELLKLVAR